ncbi:MAG: hypothetical protein FD130_813, partial [Halothiobacillaceae bacterium]
MRGVVLVTLILMMTMSRGVAAEMLIVLNKSDQTAALVDPQSYATITQLPTGPGPHEVAVSADNR